MHKPVNGTAVKLKFYYSVINRKKNVYNIKSRKLPCSNIYCSIIVERVTTFTISVLVTVPVA